MLSRRGSRCDQRGDSAHGFATLPAGLANSSERADVQVAYLAQDEVPGDHMNVAGPDQG